jgi:uncharacterized membrane protein YhiD involved in acid resistance
MTLTTIFIRLFVAALIGGLIGLNRFAHHRYIGVRTLALVSLGAAGLIVAALRVRRPMGAVSSKGLHLFCALSYTKGAAH